MQGMALSHRLQIIEGNTSSAAVRTTLVLAAGMFLLAACATQPKAGVPEGVIPSELRQIIDENRRIALPPPHPDLENIMGRFAPPIDEGEDARIAGILRQKRRGQMHGRSPLQGLGGCFRGISGAGHLDAFLTHEQLGADIRFLFDLLRHGYGGYWYFGGDDVFLPIREAMLGRLAGMSKPLQVSSFLNDLILPALRGVIADKHFQVHDITFWAPSHVLYMNEEFILRRRGSGFVTEIDGALHRVLEVRDGNAGLVDGILPTLTPEGEFAWAFGLVRADGRRDAVEITVLLENTGTGESHSRRVNLPWVPAAPRRPNYPISVTREVGGITVLENRTLVARADDLADFFYSGYLLRDRPVLIMDLRGNSGGLSSLPRRWVGIYTGQEPTGTLLFAASSRRSQVMAELHEFFVPYHASVMLREARAGSAETEAVCRCRIQEFMPRGLSVNMGVPRQIPIPNENLVIVLTDNDAASGGDLFAGYLRQLENVLFVGTNTLGALVTGGVGRTRLYHSGLDIMFGTRLNLRPDLSQFEGVGFKPDLWVPPGESLERVLRFVERYGLARPQGYESTR